MKKMVRLIFVKILAEINYKKTELTRQRDELNQELNMLKDALKDATEELKENYQLKFGEEINLEILDGKSNFILTNRSRGNP